MVRNRGLVLAALLCLVSAAGGAGEEPREFRATSDYAFRLGEEVSADAAIFYSRRQVAYLVTSEVLTRPLIVRIPEESVVEVSAAAVEIDSPAGLARLEAGASESELGGIERRNEEIRFRLGETPAALVPAPAIVGWQSPQTIRSRDLVMRSGFARARSGAPEPKALTLPAHQQVLIEVFFGSWDGFSQRVMPGIMRLEEELSSAEFRYYGLPRRIADDPVGEQRSISGVPTLIVRIDGVERGRLVGRALQEPSESLSRLLGGGAG